MRRRVILIMTIFLCFILLVSLIVINDLSYRTEARYSALQVRVHMVYSDWYRYIGMLRGIPVTSQALFQTLEEGSVFHERIRGDVESLRLDANELNPQSEERIDSFLRSIESGLVFGRSIIENGEDLLDQDDLPESFREGRLTLSHLIGRNAQDVMGDISAYYYFQLVRKISELNSHFDRLYISRLEEVVLEINRHLQEQRRVLFIQRLSLLSTTVLATLILMFQLYGLNRYLRQVARNTKKELQNTQSHLTEVQTHLQDARFQQSLFSMTAGLSHELNTPLGICITLASHLEEQLVSSNGNKDSNTGSMGFFEIQEKDHGESISLLFKNLMKMKAHIDTFRLLASANNDNGVSMVSLKRFAGIDLAQLVEYLHPTCRLHIGGNAVGRKDLFLNSSHMGIIFTQLVINARDHARAENLTVEFMDDQDALRITVSDDGVGVPEQDLRRIGEPFFTTDRPNDHIGLGLPIVLSLVGDKLKGQVDFQSRNRGLEVSIRIPIEMLQNRESA